MIPLLRLLPLLLLASMARAEASSTVKAEHVTVSLVRGASDATGVIPMGVEFALEPEWHVYWKNPGDSGIAPKFRFDVEGATVSPTVGWPAPERIPLGDLTNYGYNGRVVFPFSVKPNAGAEKVRVALKLEWLVCKVECIPGFATLQTSFAVPAAGDRADTDRLADAEHPLPRPQSESPFRLAVAEMDGQGMTLEVDASLELKTIRELDLFPEDGELFSTAKPQWRLDGNKWRVRLAWAANANREVATAGLLLKARGERGVEAFAHTVDLSAASRASLWRALALAFLGGMILNLMPCVLPVLSIKVLSLAKSSRDRAAMLRSGWLYSLGVVTAFAALATVLMVLRAGGEHLGWGFQMQSPHFVLGAALLFFLVGLNFLGALEIGYGVAGSTGWLQRIPWLDSSFGTGILATLVATPCTAPFMGTALGLSLLLPPAAALTVFLMLGVGMAAPFLALCYFPALTSRLPRPGVWMERLKQLFAFPLFGTVVWLGWVLVQQTGPSGFLLLGASMLLLALASWVVRCAGERRWLAAAAVIVASAGVVTAVALAGDKPKVAATTASKWAPFDSQAIAARRAAGAPVFVDFTAAWCLTCQWNKKSVLETEPVQELFDTHSVALFRADWTDRDPEITKALASYGRNSVPLYVFLPPKGEAIILPELITREDIAKAVSSLTQTKESQP